MRNRLLSLLLLLLPAGVSAQEKQASVDDADFVRASLLTIGPGNDAVTSFGHAAIRLECPTHGLDYCFTFEMKLDDSQQLKFLTGQAKAGFMVAPTATFLEQYRSQGRGITAYRLNLAPNEEQLLWRNLDEEVKQLPRWHYDFITVNCGSMCVWIIEKSLLGERIVYHRLPDVLQGTYSDVMNYIADRSPWLNLFFHLRYFSRRNDMGNLTDKMAPQLLAQAWMQATFTDESGKSRPVITVTELLSEQTLEPEAAWLSPMAALALLTIIVLILFILTKKRTIMKKTMTPLRSKRLLMSAVLTVFSVLSAIAGGTDWYAYKVQAEAYPTGAGLVYVDINNVSEENIKWAAKVDREFTTTSTLGYGYAKANEGWQLLGFAKDTVDVNGDVHRIDSVADRMSEDGSFMLTLDKGVTSKHIDAASGEEVSDDSLTVAGKMPLDPNNYFRALFTHVAVAVNELQTSMGGVTIDKLVNNLGDAVTLTATPANEFCSFVNWTCGDQVVSTEPQLTVNVTKVETYVANFSDSRAVTLHFPAEGGYMPFYSNYDFELHYLLEAYSPTLYYGMANDELVDSIQTGTAQRISHLKGVTSGYFLQGKKATILYGKGDVTIAPYGADEASDDESYSCGLLRWSGEKGVMVDTLATGDTEKELTYIYYTFDIDKLQFNRITTGTIAPNSVYMRIFGNMVGAGLEAPEVIYYNEDVESQVLGIRDVKGPKAVKKQGIYTLDGRKVEAPARGGIYVTDGRKIIVR